MLKIFRKKRAKSGQSKQDRGILVFENTTEVIKAENILTAGGWSIEVKGPPPEIRSGCDLVIEFPLIEELSIIRELSEVNIKPVQVVPVTSVLLEPVDLLHEKEYGKYLMVRAANMKITVDKETQLIVNVSGGGCPDVPYLAEQMVNKHLDSAPHPRDVGYTLCAYALQIAYERVVKLCLV
ncbi:MAG: DUF3343 domain-containing protein [Peptococcaceae bacterium]|nr:DUF3343 domain-containing protein [Peptococcaceae bacterium]NQS76853.1 DUF3343 domain-containing protein [Candidatus Syntrophopropionicum ammoniitolerans]